ncbi:MAG: FAD-dependent oxidoreductase, partial [Acetobacteraceae bacterium]|nr:FAD-dependent oxidoreductase [Acetobacteraceae bacterium]
ATIAPMDSEERYRALGCTVLRDSARFVAPDCLSVGGRRLTARRIVIAAGSRPVIPAIPGLSAQPFLTNETLFLLPEKPEHLLILGGGPIGLEMGQAYAGLGCRVSVVQSGPIAAKEDPELVAPLRSALRADEVGIVEHAEVARTEPGPALVLADGTRIAGSHLLIAVGRRPNLDDLGLDAGGISAGPGGIATDRGLRSLTNRRVFAVGDIADPEGLGPRAFTHAGGYHASIVIRRALFRLPARLDYRAFPRVTYTDPELAQVGMTECQARRAGHDPIVLRWQLADNDRAIAEGETAGLAKLVCARGRVLGAGLTGAHAGEAIGAWTLAIGRRIPLSALAGMIVPYPTRAEAAKRAAGTYYESRLFSPGVRRLVRALALLP